jgi:hypothetical protein
VTDLGRSNHPNRKPFFPFGIQRNAAMTDKTKDYGVQGEGDYKSARVYKRHVEGFIQKKNADTPKIAKAAERAVDGAGDAERKRAEEKGKSKARH